MNHNNFERNVCLSFHNHKKKIAKQIHIKEKKRKRTVPPNIIIKWLCIIHDMVNCSFSVMDLFLGFYFRRIKIDILY